MSITREERTVGARADYLDGDPAAPGPIAGGTLALDGGGLLFRQNGRELRVGIGDLHGMTVTGSRVRRRGFKPRLRGYTKVAVYRDRRPMVWEFAIDRSKAVLLRDRINRALSAIGRPPLPFVEALDGFGERSRAQATGEMAALPREAARRRRVPRRRKTARRTATPRRTGTPRRGGRHHSEGKRRSGRPKLSVKQRRLILAAVGAIIFIEIVVPLLILGVF